MYTQRQLRLGCLAACAAGKPRHTQSRSCFLALRAIFIHRSSRRWSPTAALARLRVATLALTAATTTATAAAGHAGADAAAAARKAGTGAATTTGG